MLTRPVKPAVHNGIAPLDRRINILFSWEMFLLDIGIAIESLSLCVVVYNLMK